MPNQLSKNMAIFITGCRRCQEATMDVTKLVETTNECLGPTKFVGKHARWCPIVS